MTFTLIELAVSLIFFADIQEVHAYVLGYDFFLSNGIKEAGKFYSVISGLAWWWREMRLAGKGRRRLCLLKVALNGFV